MMQTVSCLRHLKRQAWSIKLLGPAGWQSTLYHQSKKYTSSFSSVLSKRDIAELEDRIHKKICQTVYDPILKQPLGQLKWLHPTMAVSSETNTLQLLLRLPSLLHPQLVNVKQSVQETAQSAVDEFLQQQQQKQQQSSSITTTEEVLRVNVEAIATKPVPIMARLMDDHEELLKELGPGLANVAHTIAVYSCKGGVGKSTIAVNLAYELAAQGGRVGLLDLDLYGPSLPVLVQPDDCTIRRSTLGTGIVHPISYQGVKILSLGFVNTHSGVPGSGQNNGAAIMKGPMAVKVVSQLLKGTDWGDLDVLVLDLPPGTGDVQLGVLQQLQLSGAVAVSTPSKLATLDTQKGIEMFTSLGVPTMAVVENMAFFEDETGKRHFPFGTGFSELEQTASITKRPLPIIQLPISMSTNDANEMGSPLTLSRPKEALRELDAFSELANHVSGDLLRLQYGYSDQEKEIVKVGSIMFDLASTIISLDRTQGEERFIVRLFSDDGAVQKEILPSQLRSRDPRNGEIMPDSPFLEDDQSASDADMPAADPVVTKTKAKGKRSPSIIPTKVERRGRYGFAVEWGDGATIIYSLNCIAAAAGAKIS